ncbi:phage holin, LLH family [Paenibacillus sp. DMB5]|uniref:phage holin, LLH family n=1 Tax=Paenibacillus sp. DMB5 TaxID=1780103 RepID=UPI00076CD0BA|nr:phage holin, LLH family [Paenibacillus sp. DMB5]KUP22430.1 hypothetical protein AWJ19_27840 [Paenibacillus sp. DMB5]
MQTFIEQAQPYITTIVLAIIGVLATAVLGVVALLKSRLQAWLDGKLNVQQRELLHKIATEGFAYAQTVYAQYGGADKLQEALKYAEEQLQKKGITVSTLEIRAAIEDAYLKYKATLLTKG